METVYCLLCILHISRYGNDGNFLVTTFSFYCAFERPKYLLVQQNNWNSPEQQYKRTEVAGSVHAWPSGNQEVHRSRRQSPFYGALFYIVLCCKNSVTRYFSLTDH